MKRFYKLLYIFVIMVMVIHPISSYALHKTETVFSTMDSTGNIKKTTVNVQLTKLEKGDIFDQTYLDNIQNMNGNEKFSKENEKLTWKSTGKDIFYQGKLTNELPIHINVDYFLNGEKKTINEMNGKSGSIEIRYHFENKSYDSLSNMYTPFVVSVVSIIPSKNQSNVTVTNGKVVHTGSRNVVTAIASPGLYDSTKISEFKNLDDVVITYDTTKFKASDVYFVATPKLLENIDISKLDSVTELNGSLHTLQDGMNSLENGSNSLLDGTNRLNNGLASLNNGLKEAQSGSDAIHNGISQIQVGSGSISSLTVLVDTLFQNYQTNEGQIGQLQNIMSSVSELQQKLQQVEEGIASLESLEKAELLTEEQLVQLETLRATKEQIVGGIGQYNDALAANQLDVTTLPFAIAKLEGANEAIRQVLINVLGTDTITDESILVFHQKIDTLLNGILSLEEGSNNLTNGLGQLVDGSNQLLSGGQQLYDGTNQLKDGISKINREGIHKISSIGNQAVQYSNKVQSLVSLSKSYSGFSSDNANQTIFIYKLSK